MSTPKPHLRSALAIAGALLVLGLLATPASAGSFSLFGSYWDTDQLDEAGGGGIAAAFGITPDDRLELEFRASYYEELKSNEFDRILDQIADDDRTPFQEVGVEITPLEAGLRFNFAPEAPLNFYIAGGGGYYLLDGSGGFEVDDEFGFYVGGGLMIGNPDGVSFLAEVIWRKIEGSVSNDPDRLDDVDDLDFNNQVDVDLDGPAANVGIIWRF